MLFTKESQTRSAIYFFVEKIIESGRNFLFAGSSYLAAQTISHSVSEILAHLVANSKGIRLQNQGA